MRIGIDASRAVVGEKTGTETYSYHLIRELLRLDSPHDYTLYFNHPPPSGTFPSAPNVADRVMPQPRLWTHGRLSLEMATNPPDVLFVPAHVLPLVRPKRTVVTIHDLGYLHYWNTHPFLRRWYLHLATRRDAHDATRVIADSDATKKDLVERYGVAAQKTTVVYPGVDPRFRAPEDPAEAGRTALRYGLEQPYFLFLGTLHPRKNIVGMLRAYASVKERLRGPRPHAFAVVGKAGWRADEIKAEADKSGACTLGYVDFEDMPHLIGAATALVLVSFYEGFGLPALEAMACGTPVIVSNTSSLPEVVGDAGLLVDPHNEREIADALVSVAEDSGLREKLRERGLARAREFSWEKAARQVLRILEDAAGDRPSEGRAEARLDR